ncbi:RuBisCO-cytochrome methylase [Metschnikowia bicuspidata var. bicuspidata NRRL YB-4993]|uniref:Ribosomal lysine N-methyltransferase 4 n=1 Tax=Metschnikowia bicuspidata var. bicuspidata NRRL YB-4993 TaxID=869754 RepID=A0A1A0HG31_9ASCO|nr:RuBisCO-cytochrome methylase [Metschnikowia bicuspidata var. bicuspidata NRRL YB-4993]OBA22813.1 RuBisCO-cytochrome methylase [Metschnikowia bicuspidata var. bicuspidata NRRL YB-4993]
MLFDERTLSFLTWLMQNAVTTSPKIRISDFRSSGQGRCVVATDEIMEDEELFSIPRSAILNVQSSSLAKEHAGAELVLAQMTQWDALVLVLLYEWKVKATSLPWWEYFNVLPLNDESYASNQLIYWDDTELSHLAPSYIVDRIGHNSANAMYDRLVPHFEKFVGTVTKDEFRKVASVIMSYSFDVGSKDVDDDEDNDEVSDDEVESNLVKDSDYLKSMVPLADTLNADTAKHNASLFITADHLVMRSIKPIAKNDQIYNIYAEHPNSEILRRYGYVEQQGLAHDFAEVSLATFKKYFAENSSLSKDTIDEILAILEEIEIEEDEKFVLESYDCFGSGEVIFELTFLTQLFVIIAAINHKKSFNSASLEVKARAIRRVYKKTYQLLESRRLTKQFMKDFPSILKVRLSEYPRKATRGFSPSRDTPLTRQEMAMAVLTSECVSLQNCMDTEKVFTKGEQEFSVIDDEKLLRNIMQKNTFEGSETQPSKKKRMS